jgi:RNA-directed DNA polymerase
MAGVRAPDRTRRSRRAPGAASHRTSGWNQIDWKKAEREVKRLQQRIAKATMEGRWGRVRALQHLLTRSFFGKALAVRRATTNRGSKTPGVDQVIWKTTAHKYQAIHLLRARGYNPQPLRRVYIDKRDKKAKRPLGIPTMVDRAMQALYLLALDPIAETNGDRSSYGFRPRRSTHDAIAQCFTLLSRQNSPNWILEADILACFDNLSHPMLEEHIPVETTVLHKWLKAGYIEEAAIHRTEAGTPQGGIISPVLANMALDGLQGHLEKHFPRTHGRTRHCVHLVRYADDFIVTSDSKDVLEQEVRPLVESFLRDRGLVLSEKKTVLTHIDDGFDFLGFNLRKYDGKLLIKPPKDRVLGFLRKIQEIINTHKAATVDHLIRLLNRKIRGFCRYYRHVVSSKAFAYIDSRIWRMLWRWARRRHPNKNSRWVRAKYFAPLHGRNDVFTGEYVTAKGQRKTLHIFTAMSMEIRRHPGVRQAANPYDPRYDDYFRQRDAHRQQQRLCDRRRQRHGSRLHQELQATQTPATLPRRIETASSMRADREA